MHRRMPIITTAKSGSQPPRRRHVRITVQHMTDLIRIFLVYAGQCQTRESLRRSGIKLRSNVFSRAVDYWQQQESTDKAFHLGCNVAASFKF